MDDTQPLRPRRAQARRANGRVRRRHIRLSWRSRLVIAAIAVLGAAVLGVGLFGVRIASFNAAVSTASLLPPRLFGALDGPERVNILLLGYTEEGRAGALLTDSMTVLSIDPQTDVTTSISIPRDLWIEGNADLPGNGKINEAFAVGHREGGYAEAGDRAVRVIGAVTGLRVDGWLAIDFEGFKAMVDAVGGVTVTNPTEFRFPRSNDERDIPLPWTGHFPAGDIHLDGREALFYARARTTDVPSEASDYARSARQNRVLAAIRTKVADSGIAGIGQGLALLDALEGRFHTSLSAFDLAALARHLGPDERVELAEGEILEATRNSAGQYVLVVAGRAGPDDYEPLRAFIRTQLADATGS